MESKICAIVVFPGGPLPIAWYTQTYRWNETAFWPVKYTCTFIIPPGMDTTIIEILLVEQITWSGRQNFMYPLPRCTSERRVLHPSGCLAILLARVIALCLLSSAVEYINKWRLLRIGGKILNWNRERTLLFSINFNRFSPFNFQKENGGIVIYNINHVVFSMKQSANQFSSDTQRFDQNWFAGRYNKQFNALMVGRHEALSNPEISCPPRASPSGDMIFLGWTKLHVSLPPGHQMYNVHPCAFWA